MLLSHIKLIKGIIPCNAGLKYLPQSRAKTSREASYYSTIDFPSKTAQDLFHKLRNRLCRNEDEKD